MCSVSFIGDYWKDHIPLNPLSPSPGSGGTSNWWDQQSFALLQEILKMCKQLDEKMNQKDCEQDEKMEYFKKVGEKLGVTFDIDDKKEGLSFGEALDLMKKGNKVARKGWNGKNMYVFIQHDVGENWNDYVVMKTATGEFQAGWLASQTDMLAEDWVDLGVV